MRVLLLTADYPPHTWSGIGAAVEHQAQALASLGIETHVATLHADAVHGSTPRADGCGGSLPGPTPGGLGIGTSRSAAPIVHDVTAGPWPVDPRAFAWVHLHSLALAELALEICHRHNLPLAYTAHSVLRRELPDSPRARFWATVQDHLFDASDRVIFVGDADHEAAVARRPRLARRAIVVPNGVAPPPPGAAREPGSGGPIVFAGRLTASKGVHLLDGIFERIRASIPASFVIAGGHGDASGSTGMERLLARHGGACRAAGWLDRPRLDRLFAAASLVLIPSTYEPFGLTALEAMRLGAPVLAADVGGLREIVRPGSGGELVPSHDALQWAAQAVALLRDTDRHRRLSADGPAYVAARFDRNTLAARLARTVYGADA
jgi:1,4-alpha-glucan branching enzyme